MRLSFLGHGFPLAPFVSLFLAQGVRHGLTSCLVGNTRCFIFIDHWRGVDLLVFLVLVKLGFECSFCIWFRDSIIATTSVTAPILWNAFFLQISFGRFEFNVSRAWRYMELTTIDGHNTEWHRPLVYK
jgi:hypothetical protein